MTRWLAILPVLLAVIAVGAPDVHAQIGPPPATVFGSISDSAGDVPAGVPVEAYIGNLLCGESRTEKTGEGAARVTVYAIHVLADGDGMGARKGCGKPGVEIRIKVGDRFAPGTVTWASGYPIRFDITFGNATPAPIPTFTPTPTATPTPPRTTPTGDSATGTPTGLLPTEQPTATSGTSGPSSPTSQPTKPGGLASSTPALATGASGGDGFPVWAALLGVLGAVVLVGGGVGFALSRRRSEDESAGDDGPGSEPDARA